MTTVGSIKDVRERYRARSSAPWSVPSAGARKPRKYHATVGLRPSAQWPLLVWPSSSSMSSCLSYFREPHRILLLWLWRRKNWTLLPSLHVVTSRLLDAREAQRHEMQGPLAACPAPCLQHQGPEGHTLVRWAPGHSLTWEEGSLFLLFLLFLSNSPTF